MALGANELWQTIDKGDTSLRVQKDAIQAKTFAPGAGDDVDPEIGLPALTPVAYNTVLEKWVPWDANGANGTDTMLGLLDAKTVLDDADDVLANVIMTGKVHYDAVLAAVETRAVEVAADLVTELVSGPRSLGILVYNLPKVR
jgi:hypothetical protein